MLLDLFQGSRSVTDNTFDFRVPLCDRNTDALHDIFIRGFAGYIKDKLVGYELLSLMEDHLALFTRVDLRIQACRRERRSELLSIPHPRSPPCSCPSLLSVLVPSHNSRSF